MCATPSADCSDSQHVYKHFSVDEFGGILCKCINYITHIFVDSNLHREFARSRTETQHTTETIGGENVYTTSYTVKKEHALNDTSMISRFCAGIAYSRTTHASRFVSYLSYDATNEARIRSSLQTSLSSFETACEFKRRSCDLSTHTPRLNLMVDAGRLLWHARACGMFCRISCFCCN